MTDQSGECHLESEAPRSNIPPHSLLIFHIHTGEIWNKRIPDYGIIKLNCNKQKKHYSPNISAEE